MKTRKSFKYWQWRTILVSMFVYAIFYFVRKNFSIVYGLSRFINGFIVERVSTKVFMGIGLLLCAFVPMSPVLGTIVLAMTGFFIYGP